jgi:hypothetical protein
MNFTEWIPSRRTIASFLVLIMLPGCTTWRANTEGSPSQTLASENPELVRVHMRGSTQVHTLRAPVVNGDSLTGFLSCNAFREECNQSFSVALEDIRYIETQQPAGGRTAIAVLAVVGVAALIAGAASASADANNPSGGGGSSFCPSSDPDCQFSCPLVYSWDGEMWRLDSGTFGGAITPAAARTDLDNLIYAVPEDGRLRLKMANELNETDYVDAVSLLVVDHPPASIAVPDSRGDVHILQGLEGPLTAVDFGGREALERVAHFDSLEWESMPLGRNPENSQDIRDGLELTFPRAGNGDHAVLVVEGRSTEWGSAMLGRHIAAHGTATKAWYDSLDTDPGVLRQFGAMAASTGFLSVSVWNGFEFEPRGMVWEAGPEISKTQALPIDLSGIAGDIVRVRLESAPSFWYIDRVALGFSADESVVKHRVSLSSATDATGRDVLSMINDIDGQEWVLETGDEAELIFDLPPTVTGLERSYLLRSHGWYRVHTDTTAEPQVALLREVMSGPDAASRVSVGFMNEALRTMGWQR